jgi:hypothetical protein
MNKFNSSPSLYQQGMILVNNIKIDTIVHLIRHK